MGVMHANALAKVLAIFVGGSRSDRLDLASFAKRSRMFFSDELESTGRVVGSAEVIRAQAAITALTRFVWSVVPPGLLGGGSPDFRRLAEGVLRQRLGNFDGDAEVARDLAVVFKRVRQYAKFGRRATSLDLDTVRHRILLESQSGRCNHCLYEFGDDYYRFTIEEEGVVASPYVAVEGEVVLSPLYRRPELDHIIPLVFGGDSESNWQILCATCNRGKSDQISYFFGLAVPSSNRVSDLEDLTAGKRYAVIAETRSGGTAAVSEGDGAFYRIFRKDPAGYLNVDNLVARCC